MEKDSEGWVVAKHRQNPRLNDLSALVLVHVSYLDGKGNLAPQGSGKE